MIDLIGRQAAIDALGEEPEVYSGKDEYEQGLNNQWGYDVNALKALPSAQQEIIRCKDCIYFDKYSDGIEKYQWDGFCAFWARKTYENWYCSGAERRTDG